MSANHLDFPLRFDGRGRAARTDDDDHVRDMIHQLLFTNPGERVNLPTFGCGLSRLVFMPNSDVLAATTRFMVQGALQQWLGDVIQVDAVTVENDEARLTVEVTYTRIATGERQQETFVSPGGET